jgi:hypothetical protein
MPAFRPSLMVCHSFIHLEAAKERGDRAALIEAIQMAKMMGG